MCVCVYVRLCEESHPSHCFFVFFSFIFSKTPTMSFLFSPGSSAAATLGDAEQGRSDQEEALMLVEVIGQVHA